MPQRKNIRWAELRVGIVALVSVAILIATIFLVTGQNGLFSKTETLYTYSSDAGGLKTGAIVRLAGVDVGNVENVQLSGRPDLSQAVQIVLKVDKRFASDIRSDSFVLLAAEGLLGERYINITRGTAATAPIPDGGTITFHSTAEFGELVGGSRDLIDNLNTLTTQLNSIVGTIQSGQGTVGRLIMDGTLFDRLNNTVNQAQNLVSDLNSGKGSLGLLLKSNDMYNQVNVAVAKMNGFMDALQSNNGTLGKLIKDPALYNNAQQLISHGTTLVDNINQGRGTLGKLATDEELYRRLNTAVTNLNNVMAGIQSGQGTIGRLFQDPTLYNNLNGTSVEVRELLGDFRKDPKKFLTIHLKVF